MSENISFFPTSPPADMPKKSVLGQYMTPPSIAAFMASLFRTPMSEHIRFLDAGAGKGALANAFLQACSANSVSRPVRIDLYEIDSAFIPELKLNIAEYSNIKNIQVNIFNYDFIEESSNRLCENHELYTHSMLNPPYRKLNSKSVHSKLLKNADLHSANLYTAFLSIAIRLTKDDGEIVSIIPRSFCNGLYHKKFREFLTKNCSIKHIHLFKSRTKTFNEYNILQENIIVLLQKNLKQEKVTISISTDGSFDDYKQEIVNFSEIIHPDDLNKFIRIPIAGSIRTPLDVKTSLHDLSIEVSTGPVVDFRALDFLHHMPEEGDAPLVYPGHLNGATEWPKAAFKKPNAIKLCPQTTTMLYPSGFYVAIRRMSSKEEKRRIVAHLINPDDFYGYSHLGFENHLNVIHCKKKGLEEFLARGIVGYLNSSYVNSLFHCFNGHTQVNATDLRSIKYPSRNILTRLGKWMKSKAEVVPIVQTGNSGFLACLFPYQAAFNNPCS
jgi:Predicted O-methyltransferase